MSLSHDPALQSPARATLLSLMPGLGQVYLGYPRLGFLHGFVAAVFVALMSTNRLGMLEPFFGVAMIFFYLYNLVDAYRRALLLREGVLRVNAADLPDGILPVRVRLGLGAALILVGTASFLRIRFGISFAWLAQWWPLGLILLGLYLLVNAVKDRAAEARGSQA